MSSMTCGTNLRYFSLYPEKEFIPSGIIHYYFRITWRTPRFLFINDWFRFKEIIATKMVVEDGTKSVTPTERNNTRRPTLKIVLRVLEQYMTVV